MDRLQNLFERARERLASLTKYTGARLILDILPESEHSASIGVSADISQDSSEWPAYSAGLIREMLIPMTDRLALDAYIKRSKQLFKQIAGALDLGDSARAEELKGEFEFIRRHIREVRRANGRIRHFPTTADKYRMSNTQSLNYVLSKLRDLDPEVYHYLKAHVKTGAILTWVPDVEMGEDD